MLFFKLLKNCHRPTPQNKRSRNCMSTKLILFIFKPQKRLHCSTKSEVKKNWILTDYIFNFFLEMSLSQFWYKITKKCNDVRRDKSEIFLHWYPLFQLLIGNWEIPNELATTHASASKLVLLSVVTQHHFKSAVAGGLLS